MSSASLTPRASASVDEEKRGLDNAAHQPNTVVESAKPGPEISADLEKGADEVAKPAGAAEEEYEYITGVKLILVMTGVTLVCFIMLLDTSIITTVSSHSLVIYCLFCTYYSTRPSLESPVTLIPSQMWAGMVVHTFLQSRDIPSSKSHLVQQTDEL